MVENVERPSNNLPNNDNNTASISNNSNYTDNQQVSIDASNTQRMEQMWEVYNRVIKMKEEQTRCDAEEIVKLKFTIQDLQNELKKERTKNSELRKENTNLRKGRNTSSKS